MVSWVSPNYSKKQVTRAGNRIGEGNATVEDYIALENWRASHAYILNTFQSNLRNRSRGHDIAVGTRLKRRVTIENKLRRFPDMQLSRMHDIAGCRVIFPSIEEMLRFRQSVHDARFNHKRRGAEEDKWNYIIHAKSDGYRGIHDVYEYDVLSAGGKPWNGLLLEIQYRTYAQHSWATAVEVVGLLTHNNPKFGQGRPELIEFFSIASELIARCFESMTSSLPKMSGKDLKDRLRDLEKDTRILQLFRRVNTKVVSIDFRKNNILIFPFVSDAEENTSDLQIITFDNVFRAINRYNSLEKDWEGRADVVLVRADSFENMRITFRNYFADTTEFVALIDEALSSDIA